jgi:hypothetical protein
MPRTQRIRRERLSDPERNVSVVVEPRLNLGSCHRMTAAICIGLGVLCALLCVVFSLFPRAAALSSRLLSLHSLILVLLCWLPGLSLAIGPVRFGELLSRKERKVLWCSLVTFWLGATLLVLGGAFSKSNGYRYFLAAFESSTVTYEAMAIGHALIATAMGINGAFWVGFYRRSTRGRTGSEHRSVFLRMLAVTGFVHLIVVPFAWLMPWATWMAQHRIGYFFSHAVGGDPSNLAKLFWVCVEPVRLVALLPAIGLMYDWLTPSLFADDRHPVGPVPLESVAIAILSFFFWPFRLDVFTNVLTMSFFVFPALSGIAVMGAMLMKLRRAIEQSNSHETHPGITLFAVAVLSLGVLGLVPMVLPGLGNRLQGTPFETAQLHGIGGGVLLVAVTALLKTQMQANTRAVYVPITLGIAGACMLLGTELYFGISGRKLSLAAMIPSVFLVCIAFGAILITGKRSSKKVLPEATVSELENEVSSSERYSQSNIA